MSDWGEFGGVNQAYVLELYERFRQDPSSVDAATRAAFERSAFATEVASADGASTASASSASLPSSAPSLQVVVGAVNLAESIRRYGHLAATIDPLGSTPIGVEPSGSIVAARCP